MSITVTLQGIIVGACWLFGVSLAVADMFVQRDLAATSVTFVGLAVMLFLKGCVERAAANWTAAYEVGKEAGQMRRVH